MPISNYRLNKAEETLQKGQKEVNKEVDPAIKQTYIAKLDKYVDLDKFRPVAESFPSHQTKVGQLREQRDRMKLMERLVNPGLNGDIGQVRSQIKETRRAYKVGVLYIYWYPCLLILTPLVQSRPHLKKLGDRGKLCEHLIV